MNRKWEADFVKLWKQSDWGRGESAGRERENDEDRDAVVYTQSSGQM